MVFSTSGIGSSADAGSPAEVVAAGLVESGVSYAIVEPRLFLENLLLPPVHTAATVDGRLSYSLRADYAVSWASRHYDKPITYEAMQPEVLGEMIIPMFGEAGALPAIDSYVWRDGRPDETNPEQCPGDRLRR